MKTTHLILALSVVLWMAVWTASAGLPRPMVIYYGQACDRYGQVYASGADLFLMDGTNEVARTTITGSLAVGVNFILRVPYDSTPNGTDNYVAYAVDAGDELTLWVADTHSTRQVSTCTVPVVGHAGEIHALRIVAGEDADADGIPDAWEAANGLDPSNAADASGDPDGDGHRNEDEYLAGTLPWLASDSFSAAEAGVVENGLYRLAFHTVYGKVYSVQAAPLELNEDGSFSWTSCAFSRSADEAPSLYRMEGDGEEAVIYLDMSNLGGLWRLVIE